MRVGIDRPTDDGVELGGSSPLARGCFDLLAGLYRIPLGSGTAVMGVLNVTPDSFYDGGRYCSLDSAVNRAVQIEEEGADIIDIGGESTRPGSSPVSLDEELGRVVPVVREVVKRVRIPVSVDTTKAQVAEAALNEGASIINDISGLGFEPETAEIVARFGAAIVLMHTPSRPRDMQSKTDYSSLVEDVKSSLSGSIERALEGGVKPESIVIDPGIGFGKTALQSLSLIKHLSEFQTLGKPILIGTSRKSFIARVLETEVGDRLHGTAATVALSIVNGASIIRVHDVIFMKGVARMVDSVLSAH